VRGALRLAAAAVGFALLAGCGGGGPAPDATAPSEPPPLRGTGYFVGSGAGLGASLDLLGDDPASRAVAAALAGEPESAEPAPVVGIASVVNREADAVPAPRFTAVLSSGGAVPMASARDVLEGRDDPAARRAARALPPEPSFVAGGRSAVLYVVLAGARPREVESVRMVAVPGRPVVLQARTR